MVNTPSKPVIVLDAHSRFFRARSTGMFVGDGAERRWVIGPVIARVTVKRFAHHDSTYAVIVDDRHCYGGPARFLTEAGHPSELHNPLVDWHELDADEPTIGDLRAFLYRAADALDSWEDTDSAVIMRTAAELLGSPGVLRRLRFEALVRTARTVEAEGARPTIVCRVCGGRNYEGADRCGGCGSPRPDVDGWTR